MNPLNFTRAPGRPWLVSCLLLALAQAGCGSDGDASDGAASDDGQAADEGGNDGSNDGADDGSNDGGDDTSDGSEGGAGDTSDDGAGNDADGSDDDMSSDGVDDTSGDDSDPGYMVHDVAADALCNELAMLLCEAEQACCQNADKRHATVEACVSAKITPCLNDLAPPAGDARTGYSPQVAGEQLGALYEQLDSCALDMGEWFVAKDGLFGMFTGTVQAGGSCTPRSTTDASAVLSCSGDSVCGVTEAFPLPTFSCGNYKQAGGSCVSEVECAEGLRCNITSGAIGKCEARLADGQDCSEDADCTSLLCRNSQCAARSAESVYCFK